MDNETQAKYIQEGDLVVLVGKDYKEALVKAESGKELQTHRGVIKHDAFIGKPWGSTVTSHMDYKYQLYPPSFDQLTRSIKRATQIIYPKDIGHILMKLNIAPGTRVVEAGTGSGGLTMALARAVQPHGHVYTYEAKSEVQAVARKNLERLGLEKCVTFKVRDIQEGFDETDVDAVFLDVREPWYYYHHVHAALKGGGFFGTLVPTTNQVSALLRHFGEHPFGFIEVEELMLRPYKAVGDRLRPFDRMIAHTGYMIFARSLYVEE